MTSLYLFLYAKRNRTAPRHTECSVHKLRSWDILRAWMATLCDGIVCAQHGTADAYGASTCSLSANKNGNKKFRMENIYECIKWREWKINSVFCCSVHCAALCRGELFSLAPEEGVDSISAECTRCRIVSLHFDSIVFGVCVMNGVHEVVFDVALRALRAHSILCAYIFHSAIRVVYSFFLQLAPATRHCFSVNIHRINPFQYTYITATAARPRQLHLRTEEKWLWNLCFLLFYANSIQLVRNGDCNFILLRAIYRLVGSVIRIRMCFFGITQFCESRESGQIILRPISVSHGHREAATNGRRCASTALARHRAAVISIKLFASSASVMSPIHLVYGRRHNLIRFHDKARTV